MEPENPDRPVSREIFLELLGFDPAAEHGFARLPAGEHTERQLAVLTRLVIDLVMEVEALRSAAIEDARRQGIAPHTSSYAEAYHSTALLTHNAAGPSDGVQKLLSRWVGAQLRDQTASGSVRAMREVVMLRRLGFSEEQLAEYVQMATEAEQLT